MTIKTFDELEIDQKNEINQLINRFPFELRKMFPSMQERFEEKLRLISPEFYNYYITGIKDVECK